MKNLKPCPFCGSDADDEQGFHDLIVIGCSVCETAQTKPFEDYETAMQAWNLRSNDIYNENCWVDKMMKVLEKQNVYEI
jgi:hypothetical protein